MSETTPIIVLAQPGRPEASFDPASVFEPGAILPEQLEPQVREGRGSRALMLAVLEEAILCIVGDAKAAGTGSGRRTREATRAREWVRVRDPSWLFSFESVCAALDIEPEPLRDALLVKLRPDRKPALSSSHRVLRNRSRVEQKRTKRPPGSRATRRSRGVALTEGRGKRMNRVPGPRGSASRSRRW
jgi:hypothetical protein